MSDSIIAALDAVTSPWIGGVGKRRRVVRQLVERLLTTQKVVVPGAAAVHSKSVSNPPAQKQPRPICGLRWGHDGKHVFMLNRPDPRSVDVCGFLEEPRQEQPAPYGTACFGDKTGQSGADWCIAHQQSVQRCRDSAEKSHDCPNPRVIRKTGRGEYTTTFCGCNKIDEITEKVAAKFRTFGGGRGSSTNILAEALKNEPPVFAAGVSVREVVEFVLQEAKK